MHPSCGDLRNKKSLVHETVPSVSWDKTVTPAVPPMLALMRPLCTYDQVGIVQFVDDASLNQIEAAIEAELDAKAQELGVTFDSTLYNGQGDATTLNQIGAELVSKGVDLIVPIATPAVKIMQSATEDTLPQADRPMSAVTASTPPTIFWKV